MGRGQAIKEAMREFGNSEFSSKSAKRSNNMISDFDLAVKELEKKERSLTENTEGTEAGE